MKDGAAAEQERAIDLVSDLIDENDRYPDPSALMDSPEIGHKWGLGFVTAGPNRYLYFSQKAEHLVRRLATVLKLEDPTRSTSYTDADWHSEVRKALGPAFAWAEDNVSDEEHANTILALVRDAISCSPSPNPIELCIGARLFSSSGIDGIYFGPIKFETRDTWLANRVVSGNVSAVTARRIARRWSGTPVRPRKSSIDSLNERDIIDTVADFPYVCSIKSIGLASQAQRNRSLAAARLGLTAISLLWENPSYCLERIGIATDNGVRRASALRVQPGSLSFADRWMVNFPHGPEISPDEWDRLSTEYADMLNVCGSIIQDYLNAGGSTSRHNVSTALQHALLWFYEGCKQESDLIAVVNFSACLDALANGQDKSGICRLISARLGVTQDHRIFVGGPRVADLVEDIYSYGRSRTIHGSNLRLREDWQLSRARSERLARYCLISCLRWGSTNSLESHPRELQAIAA